MDIQTFVLDNGMQLWLHPNAEEPRVFAQITVNAGSKNDPPHKTGLAHYLEHLMFKGTSKIGALDWPKEKQFIQEIDDLYEQYIRSQDPQERKSIYEQIDLKSNEASKIYTAGEYDRLLQSIGAKAVNAGTSYDYTTFIADIPANELEKWLTIEAERFGELVLRGFHTELETVYEEFNISQDNDFRKVFNKLMNGVFGQHPYGHHSIIGFGEDLKNPSQKEIHAFFQQHYVPENMILLLSGAVDPKQTFAWANATLGQLQRKAATPPPVPKFELTDYVAQTYDIYGNDAPFLMMAWPVAYESVEDYDKMVLLKGLLQNGKAGLIDVHLLNTQQMLEAQAFTYLFKEGGAFGVYGKGTADQSLDTVQKLLLEQVDLLKNGDFEDWLSEAIVNNFILNETKHLETNRGWVQMMNFVFSHQLSWDFVSERVARLRKLTKQDLLLFAKQVFSVAPVVIRKQQGVDTGVLKVEKPPITPIHLTVGSSTFASELYAKASAPITPAFLNFSEKVQFTALGEGVQLAYVQNTTAELFELHWIFEDGLTRNPWLPVFFAYAQQSGTETLSLQTIKNELFTLGLQVDFTSGNERSYISLSGLEHNAPKGIRLVYEWLLQLKADEALWQKIVANIKTSRDNDRQEKSELLRQGMVNFAKYGFESPYLLQPSAQTLSEMPVEQLLMQFSNYFLTAAEVYYLGNRPQEDVSNWLLQQQPKWQAPQQPQKVLREKPTTASQVYFVDFPGVQVDCLLLSVKEQNIPIEHRFVVDCFNNYFGMGLSSVVFQEIRESKAIAYSTYAQYAVATAPERRDFFQAFLGTQPDKLDFAMKSLDHLIHDYTLPANAIEEAITNHWKRLSSFRTPTAKIYWHYRNCKDLGLDKDIYELYFQNSDKYDVPSIIDFQQNHIRPQQFNRLIIGDKSKLSIEQLATYGPVTELAIEAIMLR